MTALTTALVGKNVQTLAPGPVVGATADTVLIINLDTANSVNLGNSSTNLAFPLGPLASTTLTAPVYGSAATEQVTVGIAPGGSSYSPGSLTITGPVTAEITGPIDAVVSGAVSVTSGTVDATVTGPVDIASGSVTFTNSNIDVEGIGGYITPGAYSLVLNDTSTHTVAASGGTYTTLIYNMQDYQSYTIQVKGYCGSQSTSSAPLCIPVIVSYYADAAGSVLIDTERWWMWLSNNSGGAIPVNGSGPLRGGYISVTIGNPVGGAAASVTEINIYGAGRSLSQSIWQQTPPTAITAGVGMLPTASPISPLPGDDKILAAEYTNGLTATSNLYWLPMPLFSGTVSLTFEGNATLGSNFVVATAAGLNNGSILGGTATQGTQWNCPSVASTWYSQTIEAGNAPLYLVLHTGAIPVLFTFTAQGN